MIYRLTILSIITLILNACSNRSIEPVNIPNSIEEIAKWEASGRVGIRTLDDALSGNFNWFHTPSDFSLNIVGPFGQGSTKLKQNKNGLVTLTYKDKVITGHNPATLLQEELNWAFPVKQVTYWIRGLAYPDTPAQIITTAETNLPKSIQQDGWMVTYTRFQKVHDLQLPQRIQVSKPPYKVNLIISQWTVESE